MAGKPNPPSLRQLPQVEEVLQAPAMRELAQRLPRSVLAGYARAEVGRRRAAILEGRSPGVSADEIARRAAREAARLLEPSLRRVINATGVIIHTNLGRSVLAPAAVEAVNDAIRGYSTLEYDTRKMARGSRHSHCEALICAITGAEAAIAVNNNAAAVMMVLREFAAGHEGIVSRGELVEIGGSFRIPDIMELSDARMVEVGTTNKTHPRDYADALTAETAMLLKVHQSNYRMLGFTESVGIRELRRIADAENARRRAAGEGGRVLVYEDQGSGAFERLDAFGEYAEPTVAESLAAGADLVSFSGDKLLGGPQAGIIVGSRGLIARLKANPLARALRLDKMTLAALEATMRIYLEGPMGAPAQAQIPTLRMLTEDARDVRPRAEALKERIEARVDATCARCTVVPEISRAGGGALPMCDIPTYAVKFEPKRGTAQECARHLEQQCEPPIIARIHGEALLFDARTLVSEGEIDEIAAGCAAYFAAP